jgi:hypothetical protein
MPRQPTKRGSHFSGRPTHPVFTFANLCGQLYPNLVFTKPGTGSTWSCTKRGFSCPDITIGYIGIAYATIAITGDAVVSYTTFSPFSRFLLAKKPGCVFSVILSVSAGCCLQNPRFLSQMRIEPLLADTRGALPCGVRTFLPISSKDEIERLPDAPASASGPNVQLSQHNPHNCMKCNYKTMFKCLIISLYLYRGLLIHLLPDYSRVVHA